MPLDESVLNGKDKAATARGRAHAAPHRAENKRAKHPEGTGPHSYDATHSHIPLVVPPGGNKGMKKPTK